MNQAFADARDVRAIRRYLEGVIDDGGFGDRPNLHDTRLALEILDACGNAAASSAVTTFIERLLSEPFGFTDTQVSMAANVDVISAGVRGCELLRIPVRYPGLACCFLLQCQTTSGGFERAPVEHRLHV